MREYTGLASTFILQSSAQSGTYSLIQILHLSEDYVVFHQCSGMVSPYGPCGEGEEGGRRSSVQVWSRTGHMDEDVKHQVKRLVRLRTQSCVSVHHLKDTVITESCEYGVPSEGSESCGFKSLQDQVARPVSEAEGVWFEQIRSSRVTYLKSEATVVHIDINDKELIIQRAFSNSTGCSFYSVSGQQSPVDSEVWQFNGLNSSDNATVKILFVGANHMIIYGCHGGQLLSNSSQFCRYDNEHLTVYSRGRFLNGNEREGLREMILEKTCFSSSELVYTQHHDKCEIPNVLEYGQLKNRTCTVDHYAVSDNFHLEQFSGTWYELERLRYSAHNLWESGVFQMSSLPPSSLLMEYSGSRQNRCFGPVHSFAQSITQEKDSRADMWMWLGHISLHGNPWTAGSIARLKVIWTDSTRLAIMYACHQVKRDGTCHHDSQQLFVLGRQPEADVIIKSHVHAIITRETCVDVYDLVRPSQQANCVNYIESHQASRADTSVESEHRAMETITPAKTIQFRTPPMESIATTNIPPAESDHSLGDEKLFTVKTLSENSFAENGEASKLNDGSFSSSNEINELVGELTVVSSSMTPDSSDNDLSEHHQSTVMRDHDSHQPEPNDQFVPNVEHNVEEIVLSGAKLGTGHESIHRVDTSADNNEYPCPIPMCSSNCVIAVDNKGCETCNCTSPPSLNLRQPEAAELHYDAPYTKNNFESVGSIDEAINTEIFLCAIPMCSTNCVLAIDSRGCEICDCTDIELSVPLPTQSGFEENIVESINDN